MIYNLLIQCHSEENELPFESGSSQSFFFIVISGCCHLWLAHQASRSEYLLLKVLYKK